MEASEEKQEKQEQSADVYQAMNDVTLQRVIGRTGGGDDAEEITESVTYPAGSAVQANSLPSHLRERVEAGELGGMLRPLSGDEAEAAKNAPVGEPEFGVFVAEHEAEAHALEQYGHVVVPEDQAMEAQSSSADYQRQYQQAAAEHGLSDRPNLAATNPANRERVPDEVLQGAETRTGLPYNRGPVEGATTSEEAEENSEEGGEEPTRPAPPQTADPQTIGG
jgi:hypothetical protein